MSVEGHSASGTVLDLSGITIITSLRDGGTEGVIDFSKALPNEARYVVRVSGVTDLSGNALAGDNDRAMSALMGDANGDGIVDVADYAIWFNNYGETRPGGADLDGTGTVDVADYGIWFNNYGASCTQALPQAGGTSPAIQGAALVSGGCWGGSLAATRLFSTAPAVASLAIRPVNPLIIEAALSATRNQGVRGGLVRHVPGRLMRAASSLDIDLNQSIDLLADLGIDPMRLVTPTSR